MDALPLFAWIGRCLCLLGPAARPPEAVVRAVVGVVVATHPVLALSFDLGSRRDRRRVYEIVVAYGCGFRQVTLLGLESWSGCWPKALWALYRMVKVWVRRTARWLEGDAFIAGFDRARESASDDRTALVITWLLISGGCTCSGLRADKRPVNGAATGLSGHNALMRLERCMKQHRLLMWRPAAMDLMAFVARAVKGDVAQANGRRLRFAIGALVQGLYYFHCSRETGLLDASALAWECWRDGQKNLHGLPCRTCLHQHGQTVMASSITPLTSMRWLVLPSECGGRFYPRSVRRCKKCDHLYPASRAACPFDQTRPRRGEKPSLVWTLTDAANFELDAPVDDEAGSDALLFEAQDWDEHRLARRLDAKAKLATLRGTNRLELEILLAALS